MSLTSLLDRDRTDSRVRWTFLVAAALVIAFFFSLLARREGSYYMPVDGWGVDAFELAMGAMCVARYFHSSWRMGQSAAKAFPLVLGASCAAWGLGDLAITIESIGGGSPSVPSVADIFYVAFFPLCYVSLMMVIRRGTKGSLVAISLDGVIAGLGMATVSAAYLFSAIQRAAGGSTFSTTVRMVYPVGDLLLFALAIGGLTILPREYRRLLGIAAVAMLANATGDMFNLLQPNSKIGYVANAIAWPVSLLMLASATWVQPASPWTPPAPSSEKVRPERTAGFILPAVGALAGMLVLFDASVAHVGRAAVGFATGTLLVTGIRLMLTVREGQALNSARFRWLIDNAWDIIVVAEADLTVAYVTPSVERVLGYRPADVQGRPTTDFIHPSDIAAMSLQLAELAAADSGGASFEVRVRHRDGAWRTMAVTATNRLNDPSVRGYVLNGGDVTEARRAAEDLAAARDGALAASRAKSDFLATMSHEIRTPMNGVIGLTELLLETALDADQLELASGVKLSADNLLVIVNDILDFSKIEAGKIDLEEVDLDVAGVADDVGRILATSAHTKGLELLVDVHPEVPRNLLGDGVRVQQVLLNLASNAVKFTARGEVIIRVQATAENQERVALRFEVIDMGIGIAPEDQDRLFRPFAQGDSSTTRKYGGTGLGLAICSQLVELMGGKLGVMSAPGVGSTFWFELSLKRAPSGLSPEVTRDSGDVAGQRALIVDDNATNRMIIRKQLLSWGIESVEAADGFEAISLAAAAAEGGEPFDLGVLDLNMPGMDGVELAGRLKGHPATASMTLVLLSSSGERLTAAAAHLRGFADSLTKPVRQSELFNCLVTALSAADQDLPSPKQAVTGPERQESRGMILLVEDNKMNQLVGSKVLAKLGYDFEIANHGGEAVSALNRGLYDAVLMDCQMPEMDGYQATAEIRRIEGEARRTPIIAMTAAAMDGDREACLAAGMDDYITKPVRPDALADMLYRWLAGQPLPDASDGHPTGSHGAETSPALDPDQIELLRSLDDGAGAVLSEIIDQYLAQTSEGRRELARVLEEGDPKAVERTAHTLRGASANVGASVLAALCGELEAQGRGAEIEAVGALVPRFDAEFERVRSALTLLGAET